MSKRSTTTRSPGRREGDWAASRTSLPEKPSVCCVDLRVSYMRRASRQSRTGYCIDMHTRDHSHERKKIRKAGAR